MGEGGIFWMLVAAGAILAGVAIGLGLHGRKRSLPMPDDGERIALLAEADSVVSATEAASQRLGCRVGADAGPALSRFFGAAGPDAATALAEAGSSGRRVRRVLRRDDGTLWEIRIAPRGGTLAVMLHDLDFALEEVGAPRPGKAGQADRRGTGSAAVSGALLDAGGLIMWDRLPGEGISWGAGSLHLAEGRIGVTEVVELMEMRAQGRGANGSPTGPAVMRLEAVRGGSMVPLSVFETDGPASARIGFAVDASAAATAERSLRRFVQTMTETFAHLTIGLAIFDRNQTLALFNPALAEMWQQDPVWLAQRPGLREILDRLRSDRRIPEMRDYRAWRDRLLALFDDTERADHEELWNLADGSTIRVLGRPHPHGSLALIFDDATERMQLERHGRQMVDLITSTMENLNEGLAVFAPDGRLQFVNRAFHRLWDTDPGLVTRETHVADLCAMGARSTVETEVWDRLATFATGEANRSAWTARLSLGSGRMYSTRAAPLPDGSTMALFADVSDTERIAAALRERNEALEAAEQMRSAVLDQISHRLRTPLNSLIGFAELLGDAADDRLGTEERGYLAGIQEAGAQLLDTIHTVTDLASLQIDPLEGEDGAPGIEDVLETIHALLLKRATTEEVILDLAIEGPIGAYSGHAPNLRQIVFNMLAAAIHRCEARGRVRLSGRRSEDGTVVIETREDADAEAVHGGTGIVEGRSLALPLLRRLVAAEGATIDLGIDPGRGEVRTTVRLPDTVPQTAGGGAPDTG